MNTYTKNVITALVVVLFVVGCSWGGGDKSEETPQEAEVIENRVYGILADEYDITPGVIVQGETMGKILNSFGVSAVKIDRLDKASAEVFSLRKIRGGNKYVAFQRRDSIKTLDYLVYEVNNLDFVVFSFVGDSISTYMDVKPSIAKRSVKSATINSSMWGAIMEAELPYALGAHLEDIYQWSVNFFSIQKGDNFTVIYDEIFVDDTLSIGVGQIWGAKFEHSGREWYAIPFDQSGKVEYWEDSGASLRKQMLKAPLRYSRISSKFTYSRLHPIYKVYRPHTGVDYAAPAGTPVQSVADGVITFRGWGSGGAGNMVKIKHPNNMSTGYLHLSKFATGLKVGSVVKQGEVIGYVGSTGASTGPHLDYRVWKGSTPIDPLKIPTEPSEPISEENMRSFEYVKALIMAELNVQQGAMESPLMTLDRVQIDSLAKISIGEGDGSKEDN